MIYKDRVKVTTTTTGTGAYSCGSSVSIDCFNFSVIGNGNETCYCCADGNNVEIGIGTYNNGNLTRTTVLISTNNNQLINWTSGTKNLFCTKSAELEEYTHTQSIASDTWVVTHNLFRKPVPIVLVNNEIVETRIVYSNNNTLVVYFALPQVGTVICS